jgi:hypothetical protein
MDVSVRQYFPAMDAGKDKLRAAWLNFDESRSTATLAVGVPEEEGSRQLAEVEKDIRYFSMPQLKFCKNGDYFVFLVHGQEFQLEAFRFCGKSDHLLDRTLISESGKKTGSFAVACRADGLMTVVWESWGRNAIPVMRCRSFSGEWENFIDLTVPNCSTNWPSANYVGDELFIAFCVPNLDKAGYDCILMNCSRDISWRLNAAMPEDYHIYPEISSDSQKNIYVAWEKVTMQEAYGSKTGGADSTYCYLQDELSRRRRAVFWNRKAAVVRKYRQDERQLCCVSAGNDLFRIAKPDDQIPTTAYSLQYPVPLVGGDDGMRLFFHEFDQGKFVPGCVNILEQNSAELNNYFRPNRHFAMLPCPTRPVVAVTDNSMYAVVAGTEIMAPGSPESPASEVFLLRRDLPVPVKFIREINDIVPQYQLAPQTVKQIPDKKVFFGNIHIHTDISICRRLTQQSMDFNARMARDLMGQDFTALTDHAEAFPLFYWQWNLSMVEFFNFPEHYVLLPAYEWSGIDKIPHMNVYFPDERNTVLKREYGSLSELWQALENVPAITICHHPGTSPFVRDWDEYDERFETLVEIFQDRRGNYEYLGAPENPGESVPEQGREHKVASGFVDKALKRGYRLGFCAGGDHMGLSMTAVMADELNREAIFQAMYERHCYAVTAPEIFLHTEVDSNKIFHIEVAGPTQIKNIAIVSASDELAVFPGKLKKECEVSYKIPVSIRYVYTRVIFEGGNIAWSSPVWLD